MEDRESLLGIRPDARCFAETGGGSNSSKAIKSMFVGELGDDLFTVAEPEFAPAHLHGLLAVTQQMHFDAPFVFVVNRAMFPARQIEIGSKLTVRSNEQIQIERRRHPGAVIVSRFNDIAGFLQIDADNEAAILPAEPANAPQEILCYRRLEISDRRAR